MIWAIDLSYLARLNWHGSKDARVAAENNIRFVARILKNFRPDGIVACLDWPPYFRHEIFPAYKGKREAPPDDFIRSETITQGLLIAAGVPLLDSPGFEGEDVMATVARHVVGEGQRCVLVSKDKDVRQLLRHGQVTSYRKGRDAWGFLTAEQAETDWGVKLDQFIDFQILCGDPVDGITGAAGIGPKKAANLLCEHGSVENAMNEPSRLPEGAQRALSGLNASLTRQLVTLRDDVPLVDWWEHRQPVGKPDFDWECLEAGLPDLAGLF